jgi:hypothetical protein
MRLYDERPALLTGENINIRIDCDVTSCSLVKALEKEAAGSMVLRSRKFALTYRTSTDYKSQRP